MWVTLPTTTAITAIQNSQPSRRRTRNRVQSDSLRWVARSNPPKTVWVQNRW